MADLTSLYSNNENGILFELLYAATSRTYWIRLVIGQQEDLAPLASYDIDTNLITPADAILRWRNHQPIGACIPALEAHMARLVRGE